MTNLQKAEEKVYTGFEAMGLMSEGISVAQQDKQHVEFYKGENGAIKGKNHKTGFVGKLDAELGEFMAKKFVKFVEALKVGDYAKVAHGGNGFSKEGDILTLTSVSGTGFETKKLNGKYGGFKYAYNLVRATSEEVAEAMRSVLNVGDYAKVIGTKATVAIHGVSPHRFESGTVVKLTKKIERYDGFRCDYLDGHDYWHVHRNDLLPLTAEEVAEVEQEEKDRKAKEKAEKERKEKEAAAKKLREQQEALQAGEFAKIIGNSCNHNFSMGEVVRLTRKQADGFRADYVDGHDFWFVNLVDLAPLTGAELLKVQQGALKVGDTVKVLANGSHGFKEGEVLRIYDIVNYGNNTIRCERLDGKRISKDYFYNSELALATKAEVKEAKVKAEKETVRQKYIALGRKVNELKAGDIVRVTKLYGASAVSKGDFVEVRSSRGDGDFHDKKHGYVLAGELVVPVEQRFDTKA